MSTWGSNNLGSQSPPASSGSGFSGSDWATMIGGVGQGAGNVFSSMSQTSNSKKEAREAKRRVLANLFKNALERKLKTFRSSQEYEDEMADTQAEQLKDMARGFAASLSGSTGRR